MTNYCNKRGSLKSKLPGLFLIPVIVLLALTSCEDDESSIGAGLLPGGDFANFFSTDTFSLSMYTMYEDSVVANPETFFYRMGQAYSPRFGTSRADFVTELNLSSPWPGDGINSIDSVFLILRVRSVSTEESGPQFIELRENLERLDMEETYWSNRDVDQGRLLATVGINNIKADTTYRVPLSRAFGDYMLRDTSKLFISSTEPDFRSFFKGIWFRMNPFVLWDIEDPEDPDDPEEPEDSPFFISFDDPGDPGDPDDPPPGDNKVIPMLMMLESSVPSSSGILVYYTNADGFKREYSFVLSDRVVRYARYFHDFSTAEEGKEIPHINDFVKDTMVYQQQLFGTFVRIEIPGLDGLKEFEGGSVNKARLTIPVFIDEDEFTATNLPDRLIFRYTNSEGRRISVPDYFISPLFFSGTFSTSSRHYVFNIPAFIQKYLEGEIEDPVIEIFTTALNRRNVILKANDASVQPELQVSMTKF